MEMDIADVLMKIAKELKSTVVVNVSYSDYRVENDESTFVETANVVDGEEE